MFISPKEESKNFEKICLGSDSNLHLYEPTTLTTTNLPLHHAAMFTSSKEESKIFE